MFRKDITVNSAKKVVDAVKALANAGDPATAEAMRRWFNSSFRGYTITTIMDGKRITGYRLESEKYGVEIREVAVKCPGARKEATVPGKCDLAAAEDAPNIVPENLSRAFAG